jgi:hypothetical protein
MNIGVLGWFAKGLKDDKFLVNKDILTVKR